jgi:hypothetical protein
MIYRFLSCAPLVLIIIAWVRIYFVSNAQRLRPIPWIALAIATVNALFAAATYVYYRLHPLSGFVPPWQDPEIGNMGLLFLSAPTAMIVALVAAARGGARWVVAIVELASVPLVIIGFYAVMAF